MGSRRRQRNRHPCLPLAAAAGTLAGSTILLLSLGFGISVILGRCDLSDVNGRAIDKQLTRGEAAHWAALAGAQAWAKSLAQPPQPCCCPSGLWRGWVKALVPP